MTRAHHLVSIACTALPGVHAKPQCRQCSCTDGYLGRYVKANSSVGIRWVCDWCEDYKTSGDLPRSILPATVSLVDLPKVADRSDDPPERPACVVCGRPGDEFHHWAPRAIFPDWPWELSEPLCKPHHDEWHQTMRAHGLRWPHELQKAS